MQFMGILPKFILCHYYTLLNSGNTTADHHCVICVKVLKMDIVAKNSETRIELPSSLA
jgi:hypothetical protein